LKDNDISAESFVGNTGYVAELVDPEHVGLGLDFVYYPEQFYRQVLNNPGLWREEYRQNLDGFRYFTSEELPLVTEILMNRGCFESEIRGVLGENFLCVTNRVWK
jgi:membrane dipeptidase